MQVFNSFNHARPLVAASGILAFSTLLIGITFGNLVHADDVVDNVVITVPESCTFSEQMPESNQYSVEIAPGHYTENIGNTTFQVFCNDNNGYSVYAVGYSGNTIGNTDLISSNVSINNIATGTTTSGTTSSWSMKMLPVAGTYAPTIENGYSAYKVVPSAYTKVATFPSLTDRTTGSAFQAKYAIYAGNGQAAGTFTGKVKYTLVHPDDAEAPTQPQDCASNKICYWPNANAVVDSMGDQSNNYYNNTSNVSSNMSVNLWPTNFKRSGYGFAGWSDAYDYKINKGSSSNPNAHIYGPMETITTPADMSKGLSLYAVWVKSQGNLQGWTGCSSIQQGDVTALTDVRDNNTYAIAKLADGKCWMIENLRLANKTVNNIAIELSNTNTNNPALPLTNTWWYSKTNYSDSIPTSNSLSVPVSPSSSTPWCTGGISYCYYQSMLSTDNTTNTVINMTTPEGSNIYSYGNYYNWYSATAGNSRNFNGSDNQSVDGSICPTGWRLPKGGSSSNAANSDFWQLGLELMGVAPSDDQYYPNWVINAAGKIASVALRSFPYNFLYTGAVYDSSLNGRGTHGYYWTSTKVGTASYSLSLEALLVLPATASLDWSYGSPIRCLSSS